MKILFVHQNYPAQFRHIAPTLVKAGHQVMALRCNSKARQFEVVNLDGVKVVSVAPARSSAAGIHPWLVDLESKCIRGEAILHAALKMRNEGFTPDVIWAHPGWGESLFIKNVWPNSDLRLYCEFYYNESGADTNFDPEFDRGVVAELAYSRLMMKNINQVLSMSSAKAGLSPTEWQKSSYPASFQDKITIVHDGIDTNLVCPNPSAVFGFKNPSGQQVRLTRSNKVVTFVNRNLEPYRGYHVFMRSLPRVLASNPDVHIVLVGGEGVSYGESAPEGASWAEIYRREVFPLLTEMQKMRVHFVGHIPYLSYLSLLQISSVHVYLTYPFVLSWSLLEAMSAGCVVLASSTGPLLEVIQDGVNGVLFDFFNIDELSNKLIDLLNRDDVASTLGQSARATVLKKYDLQSQCLPRISEWLLSGN